jgi:hypothetical protein
MDRSNLLKTMILLLTLALIPWGLAEAGPGGGTWYANSPAGAPTGTALAKFVDSLPGLGLPNCTVNLVTPALNTCNANNLGQYIPIAEADTLTSP